MTYKLLTNRIKIDNIRNFVEFICEEIQIDATLQKAASSSGKYHPEESNGDWGILEHTNMALLAFDTMESLYKPQGMLDDIMCSLIRAAIILHDGWKYENLSGSLSPFCTKEHGYVGYLAITELSKKYTGNIEPTYVLQIANSVRLHMSNWLHSPEEQALVENAVPQARLVMLADFLASNKKLVNYKRLKT